MRYTLESLRALPTLSVGQADSLKIETEDTRVWLCRCGVADGMPYDNQVTIERFDSVKGRWYDAAKHEAKPGVEYGLASVLATYKRPSGMRGERW